MPAVPVLFYLSASSSFSILPECQQFLFYSTWVPAVPVYSTWVPVVPVLFLLSRRKHLSFVLPGDISPVRLLSWTEGLKIHLLFHSLSLSCPNNLLLARASWTVSSCEMAVGQFCCIGIIFFFAETDCWKTAAVSIFYVALSSFFYQLKVLHLSESQWFSISWDDSKICLYLIPSSFSLNSWPNQRGFDKLMLGVPLPSNVLVFFDQQFCTWHSPRALRSAERQGVAQPQTSVESRLPCAQKSFFEKSHIKWRNELL